MNYLGVQKTVALTKVIVAVVLASLALAVAAVWLGGTADIGRLSPLSGTTLHGVMQSAGLLFFAFAGYARLATLGEEVIEPARTIPRAIPIALGIALVVYAAVAISAAGRGRRRVARRVQRAARDRGRQRAARRGSCPPSASARPSRRSASCCRCIVGVSRTAFAMAANARPAARPRRGPSAPPGPAPRRARWSARVVAIVAAVADIRAAIGFSSFAVLVYYAITNAAALTLRPEQRRWPRAFAGLGLLGCVALAFTLPTASVVGGAAMMFAGAALYLVRRRAAAERLSRTGTPAGR